MKKFAPLCLAMAALFASAAQAAGPLQVVEEYEFSFANSTEWMTTFDVPLYSGSDPLAEVMITLVGNATSSVDATATTGDDVDILLGEVGALITATSGLVGLSIDALPEGTFAPPTVNVPGNSTVMLDDIVGDDTDMDTFTGSPAVDPFVGVGTFPVDISAIGTLSTTVSGGNVDISQATEAGASLIVQYKTMVPEPSTMMISLLGLAGFAARRR